MKIFKMRLYLFLMLTCIGARFAPTHAEEPEDGAGNRIRFSSVVNTKSGPVQGLETKIDEDRSVNVFLGIPYAAPPVGELRFQRPKEVEPWTEVLQAVSPRPICYQQLPETMVSSMKELRLFLLRPWSEDCLHLNIWSPGTKPDRAPVVFFIHGGAFIFGSGLFMSDGTLLASEGLIVVTINYRLGPFGFVNFGTAEAPGNVGLMDQNVALKWVKDNIEAFGGDPDNISLMGMSAGSASVGYHLLSPKSKGLFRGAIMMSGAPTNYWAILEPERSIAKSKSLANSLGCQSVDTADIVSCLRQRHAEDVLELSQNSADFKLTGNFVPSIDGEFIVEHPSVSVASGRFNTADVMVGTTIDEGAQFMVSANAPVFNTKDGRLFRRDFQKIIQNSHPGLTSLQAKALDLVYTNWNNPDDPYMLRDAAKDIYTDSIECCRINEFADALAHAGINVYRYVYDYKVPSPFPLVDWAGAVHAEDQIPVLGPVLLLKNFGMNLMEDKIGSRFRGHFVNFAFSGNPNLNKKNYPDEADWPMYDSRKLHLNFALNSTIRSESRTQQCALWLHLLPLLDDKKTC